MRWKYIIFVLLLVVAVEFGVLVFGNNPNLRVIACDVGQGDALLLVVKDIDVLIDGGPGKKVLRCLASHMPFWDRKIEMVILTHPQKDHYEGLIEVLKRYEVGTFVSSEYGSADEAFSELEDLILNSEDRIEVRNPVLGEKLAVGPIQVEIFNPDTVENLGKIGLKLPESDPNDYSVVTLVSYGEFDGLFTGDIGPAVIAQMISRGGLGKVEYLKVPHHGSKNGLSEELVGMVDPDVAIISVGAKNSYGHPHKEVLDLLGKYVVGVYRTDELGDVVFETDGDNLWYVP